MDITAFEIAEFIEQIAPEESGVPNDIIGILRAPDEDHSVTKVALSWGLPMDTLLEIRDFGAQMIILHEMPIYPNQESPWYDYYSPNEILPDVYRSIIVEKWEGPLTLFRAHSNWDARVPEGVPDTFGRFLGFGEPVTGGAFTRVYDIPKTTLGDLTDAIAPKMKNYFGHDRCPPRLFGDPKQAVARVGVMIGGFGGNQFNMIEEFRGMQADAVITGDLVEVIAMHAMELGIGVIETSHSFTEAPAMESMAELLKKRFKGVTFKTFASGAFPMTRVTTEQMLQTAKEWKHGKETPDQEDEAMSQPDNEELHNAMQEFKEKFPITWQRVELLLRLQRMQQELGGEFPPDRLIIHVLAPTGREFMVRSIRSIDLPSGTVVLDVYKYTEIMEGTVFIPLEMIGWVGSPNVIEHRVMGFTYDDIDSHDMRHASSSSIIRRVKKTPSRKRSKRATGNETLEQENDEQ